VRAAAPITTEPTAHDKQYFEGTHRIRPPEATWRWIEPLLPRAGITRVADVTGLDRLGIPVFQAIRPGSRNLCVSQGKAVHREGARVSAAMEAMELWHAEDLGHLPSVTASLREMELGNPIPSATLPWRPDSRRLEMAPLPWLEARPLLGGSPGWLLRQVVEIDFTLPSKLQPAMFHVTSNGLASGNSPEEARLHALCEVVERHGLYLARKEPHRIVPLDVDSVTSPFCRRLIERFRDAGFRLALYDITWELGVPVAIADAVADDLPNVWRGSGCHPDPAVALSRALTEAAQARLTYIAGARDDLMPFRPLRHMGEVFETFREPTPRRTFEHLPDLSTNRVEDDLAAVLERMERHGFTPYEVDLTRPELGVPVVSLFVPGFKEAAYG
jgi:ribosomal protein S12 methylthiotransferase accessory factor